MKNKTKKITFIIVSIIVVASIVLFVYLFLNRNKPIKDSQKINSTQKLANESVKGDFVTRLGHLVKINEKSIDFIGSEKSQGDALAENNGQNIESFNLSLTDPATTITQGKSEIRKRVDFSELKIGQEVLIVYDKNSKNLINININQPNIIQTGEKKVDLTDTEIITAKVISVNIGSIKIATNEGKELLLSVPQGGASFTQEIVQKDGSFLKKEVGLLEIPINKNAEVWYNNKTNEVVSVTIK